MRGSWRVVASVLLVTTAMLGSTGCGSSAAKKMPPVLAPQVPLGIPGTEVQVSPTPAPAITRVDLQIPRENTQDLDRYFDPSLRFSLNVFDTALQDVLRVLSDRSDRALVLDPGIDRNVSVSFRDVTLGEALSVVLAQAGLVARIEGEILYLGLPELMMSALHLSLPQVGGGEEGGATTWDGIQQLARLALSPRGVVHLDPHGAMLVVRDLPARVDAVQAILRQAIEPLRRQVMIEAMVLEVSLDDELEYGIDWSAPDIAFSVGSSKVSGAISTDLAPDTSVFSFSLNSNKLDALLNALRRRGELNVLSAPRLTTLNRVPARIAITEEIPYYTSEFASLGNDAVQNFEVEFRQTGVILEVTPAISAGGEVILDLHPTISELTGFTAALDGLPPNPIVDTRDIQTTVRASNGESVVLAGLIRRRYNETADEVPGLGRIPGLGAVFRRLSQQAARTELVVVITPVVVTEGVQERALSDSMQRLENLREPYRAPGMLRPMIEKDHEDLKTQREQ